VPQIVEKDWRLEVVAGSNTRRWSRDELAGMAAGIRATLDCTGGWYAAQTWEAVPLARLVPEAGETRSILVTSATGYRRRFPLRDLPHLYLAVGAGGEPLDAGHGAPARIVAPHRRGFWWVKWVTSIETSPRPAWWQSPFPLT
jgi:DMSO/TMAO reductase YedYZ molybdopterin-dependent catalytic subunit